jgi:hypothetical protein
MAMAMLKAAGDGAASLPISIPLRTVRSPNAEEPNAKRPNIFEKLNNMKSPENKAAEMAGTSGYQTDRNGDYEDKLAKFADSFDRLSATIASGFQSLRDDFKSSHAGYDDDEASWYSYDDDYEAEPQSNNENVVPIYSVDDLLTEKKSGSATKTDTGNESKTREDEIINIIEQSLPKDETGNPVNQKLADMVNTLMHKKDVDKSLREQIKTLCEATKRPENCVGLKNTRVDEPIWHRLQPSTRSLDTKHQEVQTFLLKATTEVVLLLNEVIEKEIDSKTMVTKLMKVVEFLSFANYELNCRRKEALRKDIDSENYLGLFAKSATMNEFLFGGDLQKKLDEIEKSNKVVSKVVPGRGGFHQRRGNYKDRRFTKRYNPYQYKSNKPAFLENRRGEEDSTPREAPQAGEGRDQHKTS